MVAHAGWLTLGDAAMGCALLAFIVAWTGLWLFVTAKVMDSTDSDGGVALLLTFMAIVVIAPATWAGHLVSEIVQAGR